LLAAQENGVLYPSEEEEQDGRFEEVYADDCGGGDRTSQPPFTERGDYTEHGDYTERGDYTELLHAPCTSPTNSDLLKELQRLVIRDKDGNVLIDEAGNIHMDVHGNKVSEMMTHFSLHKGKQLPTPHSVKTADKCKNSLVMKVII
jgi:hypothetical protein